MQAAPQPHRSAMALVFLLLLVPGAVAQNDPCAQLQVLKKEVYGFRAASLNQQQQAEKEKEVDRFWSAAQAQGPRGVSCVRAMLEAERRDTFFLFDAATLLLHLDGSPKSLEVIKDAASRADLAEINPAGYVELVLELARQGVDTSVLAAKYMEYPKVDGFLPEHSLPLDRATGAIFLYGSMPPEQADKNLIPLLQSKEKYVHDTAVLQLALNMTRESYRALAALPGIDNLPDFARKQVIAAMAYHAPAGKALPTYSREQILARLRRIPRTPEEMQSELKKEKPVLGIADDEPFIRSAIATLEAADLDSIRDARRASLMAVSDEALYEYAAYTRIILGIINRLDLYKEFRVH